jgi:dTDP-4-amino-4,6-dideoxygalactose transaminase
MELSFIKEATESGKLSGNGFFTRRVHKWFADKYNFGKVLMTSSCTDALEMCAIAMNILPGDEIIVPDYTFVSSANAFVLHGAKIIFADSRKDHPGIDESRIEELITENTKAIVVVHYAGVSVDMHIIMELAARYNLLVIEDAAQAIDSYNIREGYKKPLGSFGDFATFSFHDTKNIISGEGGLLVVNNNKYFDIMEIIWEKGTNRNSFFKGEVNKYGWVEKGSSFLPSELTAAFLFGQLQSVDFIQLSRLKIWNMYYSLLKPLEIIRPDLLPIIPVYSTNNAHMFYIKAKNITERDDFISFMKVKGINTVFHYLPLHQSDFVRNKNWISSNDLGNSIRFSETLIRLPMFVEISEEEINYIANNVIEFFERN